MYTHEEKERGQGTRTKGILTKRPTGRQTNRLTDLIADIHVMERDGLRHATLPKTHHM